MDPLTLGLIGGGLGLLKTYASDVPKQNAQKKRAAATIRWSPWTGLKPEGISQPDLFGNMLGGAGAGLAMSKLGAGGLAGGAGDAVAGGAPSLGVDTAMPTLGQMPELGGQGPWNAMAAAGGGMGAGAGGMPGMGPLGVNTAMPSINPWDAMLRGGR